MPRSCLLRWHYGHAHPEFPDPRYPGFVVAEFPDHATGIAYSTYGFGPKTPWGHIALAEPDHGDDSQWFTTLEQAFRDSRAWIEP